MSMQWVNEPTGGRFELTVSRSKLQKGLDGEVICPKSGFSQTCSEEEEVSFDKLIKQAQAGSASVEAFSGDNIVCFMREVAWIQGNLTEMFGRILGDSICLQVNHGPSLEP